MRRFLYAAFILTTLSPISAAAQDGSTTPQLRLRLVVPFAGISNSSQSYFYSIPIAGGSLELDWREGAVAEMGGTWIASLATRQSPAWDVYARGGWSWKLLGGRDATGRGSELRVQTLAGYRLQHLTGEGDGYVFGEWLHCLTLHGGIEYARYVGPRLGFTARLLTGLSVPVSRQQFSDSGDHFGHAASVIADVGLALGVAF
jgi:hypothetical protein